MSLYHPIELPIQIYFYGMQRIDQFLLLSMKDFNEIVFLLNRTFYIDSNLFLLNVKNGLISGVVYKIVFLLNRTFYMLQKFWKWVYNIIFKIENLYY